MHAMLALGSRRRQLLIAIVSLAASARVRTAVAGDLSLAWSITVGDGNLDSGDAIAVDKAGDVVGAGQLGGRFAVVKRSGGTGAALWERRLTNGDALAVAVDAAGDVYAAGNIYHPHGREVTVVKLRGSDGSVLWTASTNGGDAYALAVDKNDGLLVVGELDDTKSVRHVDVRRLSRADGHVLWQELLVGDKPGVGMAVAIDSKGSPIVTGSVQTAKSVEYSVFKLAIATGHVTWHRAFSGFASFAKAVVVAPDDDVVTSGTLGGHFTVIKLKGSSGQKLWMYDDGTQYDPLVGALQIALTTKGDVAAGGCLPRRVHAPGPENTPHVALLRGSSGTQVWATPVDLAVPGCARAAVGPLDNVLAVRPDKGRIRVEKLDGSDGHQQDAWDAAKASEANAVLLRDDALYIVGTQEAPNSTSSYLLLIKLAIKPPCKKGDPGCDVCKPPCGAHQVCEHGQCRIVEPAQPGGHMHVE